MNLGQTLVDLFAWTENRLQKIICTDGQTDRQIQTTKSSENLFIPFLHFARQRRFVRPNHCSSSSGKTAIVLCMNNEVDLDERSGGKSRRGMGGWVLQKKYR